MIVSLTGPDSDYAPGGALTMAKAGYRQPSGQRRSAA
jgi:hypothetical protein